MLMKSLKFGLLLFVVSGQTFASNDDSSLLAIQTAWAKCQYDLVEDDARQACLETLIVKNNELLQAHPDNPQWKVWLAINKASLAGVKGGFGALSLVKEAKALLEQVIDTAPNTLSGSAYTSLGSLYYQVPGWPIGFGDNDKAEKMLQKALAIDPQGIDANYFYGDFLVQEGHEKEAKIYLSRALQAKPRANRPLADAGRKKEIEAIMSSLN
ncbi:tetratricopeptide repeat protein [Marinomonas posidonica]|uniref:Uncharacterized protein n=1 Tax=Marinomonas posidonica (strain CECT 7376 / NCIMB 14433 / IVIA-Po-181) TaxID=491952 RepID=F6CV40_MARPP|nr:tetratricopeptide repeat protein [Marinomonas posidonica]AEF56460.1 hypothetical protein Mar181_3444 [Marinomonas posidonica IVIA-Po-181]